MIDLDILVILDRSGSMQDAKSDHEGGLRSFVEDQRSMAGEVRFTLVQFDTTDPCEVVYDRVALDVVKEITLVPRGGTPLLDAVGEALAHLQKQQLVEPAIATIVMVVTDGEENASKEWTKTRVKALVDDMEKAGAKILYLGANVDAFAEAGSLGVGAAGALNYHPTFASVQAAYAITSNKVANARNLMRGGASAMCVSSSLDYTDEERGIVDHGTFTSDTVTTTTTTTPTTTPEK